MISANSIPTFSSLSPHFLIKLPPSRQHCRRRSAAPSISTPLMKKPFMQLPIQIPTKKGEQSNVEIKDLDLEGKIEGLGGDDGKRLNFDLGKLRVLEKSEGAKLNGTRFGRGSFMDEDDIDVVVEERDDKDGEFLEKDDDLVKKNEVNGNGNVEFLGGGEGLAMIPGLSLNMVGVSSGLRGRDGGDLNFDESDSDSEDDLQIVLNNDNEFGVMGVERMGGMGDLDDDEDADHLVNLAYNDTLGNPTMMENQEPGEDGGTGADGERKELGDATKVNGVVAVHPKVPYGNHVFHHQFHSQFKYVRPGAAPMPGPAPPVSAGTIGQVCSPVVGPFSGRGRGDWRPSGIVGGPAMQKGYHPGYPHPAWGSNSSGRGLDFTLPSHKTIFEVDIDSFEGKPWRLPGVDMSDFFNFGLNEEGWREYCKQLEQHRLETTMQSRIRTYEKGRTEQDYDPDLPPELVAASVALEISSENTTLVLTDPGQDASNSARTPLPTGRPIQVEINYTDRLSSVDACQQRIRDSDAIEINCRGSTDEGSPVTDMVEPEDEQISDLDLARGDGIQDISEEHTKKERRRGHTMTFSSKSSTRHLHDSREATPQNFAEHSPVVEEERRMKGKTPNRSPRTATREKQSADDQNENSDESIDGKHGRLLLSPESVGAVMEQDVENQLSIPNEPVRIGNSPETASEGLDLNMTAQDTMLREDNLLHSSEKHKSSSKVEHSQETDEIDYSRATSSEDNESGSRNSRGVSKSLEFIDGVSQGEGSAHMSKKKRPIDRDDSMIRQKRYNESKDVGRRHTSTKGDESYVHKGWEPNFTKMNHAKIDGADRRRESDNSVRALHKSDENLHGKRSRVEDMRIRDQVDEIGSRHRNKARESERSDYDGHNQLREHLDIGGRRGNPDKIMDSKRNRDDGLKRRDESIDILPGKRRKEDGNQRRERSEKEIIFDGNRDSSSRRKKDRDGVSNERKREQPRRRDDDVYTVRYKEEGLFQRERSERQRDHDEWHRVKHTSEEMLSKREREDGRSVMNSIRPVEQKVWSSHYRVKDEYRGSDGEYYQKDVAQCSQQPKRSDRTESESLVQHRGREDVYANSNQQRSDGRRATHERVSTRDNCIANASESHRVRERKPKDYPVKSKEDEVGYPNLVPRSSKNQDERSGLKSDMANSKGERERRSSENLVLGNHHSSSTKLNEEVASDDEQHHSRRGRSKLERWTSHKEKDFSTISKSSSSSLQIKEPETQNSSGPTLGTKVPNEHPKPAKDKQVTAIKYENASENNHADGNSVDNKHLDTVEKLKKRSERFKLQMPGEKEIRPSKKVEIEPLPLPPPPCQPEVRPDQEIKTERPARKRRWTSNS